jgi:hypothetical protein
MSTITLEEHFVTESFLRATGAYDRKTPPQLAELQSKLLDIGLGRIADMDKSGIDLQVLSLAAMGFDALDADAASSLAHDVNDELAEAVRSHPERFGGFATLALKAPATAAAERERCVTRLGFHGALLDGTTDGLFLDDPRFLPVFEAAAHLGVPIYLHPAPPPQPVREAYYSGLPGELGFLLSIAGWAGTLKPDFIPCASSFLASSTACLRCNSSLAMSEKVCPMRSPAPAASSLTPRRNFASRSPITSNPTFTAPPAATSPYRRCAAPLRWSALIAFSSPSITPTAPTRAAGLFSTVCRRSSVHMTLQSSLTFGAFEKWAHPHIW